MPYCRLVAVTHYKVRRVVQPILVVVVVLYTKRVSLGVECQTIVGARRTYVTIPLLRSSEKKAILSPTDENIFDLDCMDRVPYLRVNLTEKVHRSSQKHNKFMHGYNQTEHNRNNIINSRARQPSTFFSGVHHVLV